MSDIRFTGAAVIAAAIVFTGFTANQAEAGYQSYSQWSYYPAKSYYYSKYYYKPTPTYVGLKHQFCIYYPSQPRYIYFFNPYRKVYWGRYDVERKGYSLLEEKDQKNDLKDIPESAFPQPGKMPGVPETKGEEQMSEPDISKLPDLKAKPDLP